MNNVNVIMYHYIRSVSRSKFPNINGLETEMFREQLNFLKNNFNIISNKEVNEAIITGKSLPDKSVVLTFDDGYIDHFENVYPILLENDIKGFFSMPSRIIEEEKVLDVNKIHFVLASANKEELLQDVYSKLDFYRGNEFVIDSNHALYKKLAIASRYDDKDIIFIKRLLQNELDERLRNIIVDDLFKKYVSDSEKEFCKELYMDYDQIKIMKDNGMDFGIHGHTHNWLGKLKKEEMIKDIDKSLEIFDEIIDKDNWTMCYPYGSFNEDVLNYISTKGCKMGFSTEVRVANLEKDNILTLPRLDTNDYPPKSNKYIEINNYK